jgi:phosphinothricin acetyltransferase
MQLRLATPGDAPQILEIYRPYVEHTSVSFETEVPSQGEFAQRIATFSSTFPYLVAEENGLPLGYAYAHAFHDRAAYRWTVETSIYVSEAAHGRHVGTALYRALLALLELQGIHNACAVVTIPNDPSMGFHQAMGFSVGGILPSFGYKLGQWHSVAYLYRPLREGTPGPIVPLPSLDPAQVADILSKAAAIS